MLSDINRALMLLARRAEQQEKKVLLDTFVDAGPLSAVLSSRDHLIVYGRRGTGKTHALAYSVEIVNRANPLAIFVDLRTIGSEMSVYGDANIPFGQRATRLLLDVLRACHDKLVTFALEGHGDPSALPLLDIFADQITAVRVEGVTEIQEEGQVSSKSGETGKFGVSATQTGLAATVESASSTERTEDVRTATKSTGSLYAHVKFGGIAQTLEKLVPALKIPRLWLVFDEWSTVPLDLQPLLADLLRRAVLPCRMVTVKIGAIEQRSMFHKKLSSGDYLGFEVGADISSAVNLDDYMVFGNDDTKAERFFAQMFFNHLNAHFSEVGQTSNSFASLDLFIARTFSQQNAFRELVRASEGVARDAINVASLAAQRADEGKISIHNIRESAKAWYQRDKEKPIPDDAKTLLIWIIENVIRGRRARAFLLEQGDAARHTLIQQLFDLRVLHVVKRGISAKDQPGKRFDVYAIDYGCYVELLTTSDAPAHLFIDDDGSSVDVPLDDYRSIRRAILDLTEFDHRKVQFPLGLRSPDHPGTSLNAGH